MVRIDLDRKIAVIAPEGEMTVGEIKAVIKELFAHPDRSKDMYELWDFRGASLSGITAEGLESVAIFIKRHTGLLAKRTAFVVGRDMEYGVLRMWESYAAAVPQERRIFRNPASALEWLTE